MHCLVLCTLSDQQSGFCAHGVVDFINTILKVFVYN